MIKIKNLTIKNFMSVGNATQGIHFDRQDLTLVLGENLDLGGDGARNGVGKTSALNALSYALYGQAISNIRKDNLINRTNGKNMLVSLEFEVNGRPYRIERGRKPNVLKFYIDDREQSGEDSAQGENKETQLEIEKILGLSHDMFKHIVALNTYTEPFLSLRTGDQRTIIEQLLGITQLSERADSIKELSKTTKLHISEEEFRIRAVQDANKRIEEQINSLKSRQRLWNKKKTEDIQSLKDAIEALSHVDIEQELALHSARGEWQRLSDESMQLSGWIGSLVGKEEGIKKKQEKLKKEIKQLEEHTCYACGQDFHDEKHTVVLEDKKKQLQDSALDYITTNGQWLEHSARLQEIGELGPKPETFYPSLDEAYQHRGTLNTLEQQLLTRLEDQDPYEEQIHDMQNQAIQEVTYDRVNELTRLLEHQEFLFKLLTSKDSFIRKKIIDQNLSYLNSRLTYYLDRMGLPHSVTFENDLNARIEELGRELDWGNLSKGEGTRVNLSLSWAFRDIFESLNSNINLLFIDEVLDAGGLDTQGIEAALKTMKEMSRNRNKSIFLVAHRDELVGRTDNVLMVRKENGFTSFEATNSL